MRLPRLRIRTLMIAVALAGLALAYALTFGPDVITLLRNTRQRWLVIALVSNLIIYPTAILGGLGLCLESYSATRRTRWGCGRWSWVFCGVLIVVNCSWAMILGLVQQREKLRSAPFGTLESICKSAARELVWTYHPVSSIWLYLVAALATIRWAGAMHNANPDAREWIGRIFAGSMITAGVVLDLFFAMDW